WIPSASMGTMFRAMVKRQPRLWKNALYSLSEKLVESLVERIFIANENTPQTQYLPGLAGCYFWRRRRDSNYKSNHIIPYLVYIILKQAQYICTKCLCNSINAII